jgi:phage baseplate assembly protein W
MTQPDFGTCWGTPSGQDLSMPSYMATGFQVVAEAVLRRWSTTTGRLIDDPSYGINLSDLIGDDLSPTDIANMQAQAAAEAQKDERVLDAQVQMTLNNVTQLLTINATITTAAGPFTMVVAVGAVTTQLLLVTP